MAHASEGRSKVFISYSHKDEDWLQVLQTHLKPIERLHGIDIWDDKKIAPGMTWHDEIRAALASAKVAVLLVTKDFLASEFIDKEEVPPLLDAAHREGVTILPVIVKPSYFRDIETLSRYQAANDPERPLIELSEAERDRQMVEIVRAISKIMRGPATAAAHSARAASPSVPEPEDAFVSEEDEEARDEGEEIEADEADITLEDALAADLAAMFDDPAQQGLVLHATDGDASIELMLIAEGTDDTVVWEVASNDDLPREMRLPVEVQRFLVDEVGFNPPAQRGDRFWVDLGPTESIDVAALTVHILGVLDRVFGVPNDHVAVGWHVMLR